VPVEIVYIWHICGGVVIYAILTFRMKGGNPICENNDWSYTWRW